MMRTNRQQTQYRLVQARRTATTATATAAVGLLALAGVVGCGTSETSGDNTPSAASSAPNIGAGPDAGGAAVEVAQEWLPQLRDLADTSTMVADCQTPSSTACADGIDAVMETVDGLSVAVEEAGLEAAFPKTMEEVAGLDLAEIQYKVDGCAGGSGGDGGGSACYENALAVAMGPAALEMTLTADQPDAATG
jgi:hypothetical protein